MKKQYFILLFFLVFCFPFTVDARKSMATIKSELKENEKFTEHYYYTSWNCDSSKCKGVGTNAYDCAGFVARVYYDYFGVDSSWGTKITDVNGLYSLEPGDIVRFDEPSKGSGTQVGHSVFVMGRSGNTVTVAEANVGPNHSIHWSSTYTIDRLRIGFDHITKAWFPYGKPSQAPAIVKPSNVTAKYTGNNKTLEVGWDYVSKASDYYVQVHKKAKADKKDYSAPVYSEKVGSSTIHTKYLKFEDTGDYTVVVKTVLDEYISKEAGFPTFSVIAPSGVTIDGLPTGTKYVGDSFRLVTEILPSDANVDKSLTWESSNKDVATVSAGYVSCVGEGTVTIKVSTANGKSNSVTFYVKKKIAVDSVTLNALNGELWTGDTFQLRATITPSNADNQDVSWSSSNKNVATVSANGKVTAIARGNTFICASVGGKSACYNVTVRTKGLALEYDQDVFVTDYSNFYLRSHLKTNDGSSIDWDKVTFDVEGPEGTYAIDDNYLDFKTNYVGEVYTLKATYYGVTSSMIIKPVSSYSASMFEILSTEGNEFTLFKGKKVSTDLYFQQKKNYYPITRLYVNKMDFDIVYDPTAVCIYDLSTEYSEIQLYDDGKGTLHVSMDMGNDVFVADQKNLVHITFIGLKDEDTNSEVTYQNAKIRVSTKNHSLSDYNFTTKLTIHTKKYAPITSISIGDAISTLEVPNTHQLKAITNPEKTSDTYTTSWSSSNENVAKVDSTGKVTAVGAGTCNITLRINNFQKVMPITVIDNTVYIKDITWNKDFTSLYKGTYYTLIPTFHPEEQTETERVLLTSSDTSIVGVYNGYNYNRLDAKNEGTVTITAKAGKFTKQYTVTVLPTYIYVSGISVSLNKETVKVGESAQASAVITPSNATDSAVTWSSNNSICTVDSNGLVKTSGVGTCSIIGKAINGYTSSKKLTVESDITSLSLNQSELKLVKGSSNNKLTATIYPTNSKDKSISWYTSDSSVITVDTNGNLSIRGTGTANVTVKSSNGKSATCKVSVVASTMSIGYSSLSLKVGETYTLNGVVTPSYASQNVTWTSSDSKVATVNNGKITALSSGSTTISATNSYGVKSQCVVNVASAPIVSVTSVSVNPTSLSISVDDTKTLSATVLPSNATNKSVTWSSSNSGVVKVSNGVITGVAPGYATITVKSSNGKTATCGVSVVAKRVDVSSITLDKTDLTLKVGNSDTITATINPSNATNRNIIWSSSNNNIVSVVNGKVTAKSIGKATITAMIGNVRSTSTVTVIASDSASVYYHTHVESIGDQAYVSNGNMAGTSHQSKRLEAIRIYLAKTGYTGNIEYRTHVQDYGWMDYVSDGEMSGTSHQSKRLEAIQIRLTGEVANYYDIYYRVHAQSFGWMSWAKNDEQAGTAGYGYRLEAIEIMLVRKGNLPPTAGREINVSKSFVKKMVMYNTHVESYGWRNEVADGVMSGTSHESKRLEAISIRLYKTAFTGSIEYRTHIQDIGWESDWRRDGQNSGTDHQSKRLEAIQIRLTGEMANRYDVYYRVHAQNFGWMGWAKNGEEAGTAHYSYRLEGIEIVVVPKGENPPSRDDTRTSQPFVDRKS